VIGRGYFVGVNDIFYVGDIASKMKEECNAIELEWLNSARIANKIPYFTVDFDENILANEVMDWIRVDISKGCFIGQEYVSRILFKGRLRKKLIFFSASYKLFEQFDSFKQFMDLTSGVHCPDTQEVFGFAYLNLDFIEAHPEILGKIVDKN
jgi:folate-binding protein YgfZ